MESSAFDIHAKRYDSWYDNNPAVYASEIAAIRQLMPSRISKHCIEIGVGTGRFAPEMCIAYGLDPSGRMMQIARTRAVECIQGVGEALPLKDSSMELALMVTCFCLMDGDRALDEVYRVLAPSGYLIIAFVEKNSPLGEKYRKKAAKSRFFKGVHFHRTEDMLSMLEEHGFGDMDIRQTLFRPMNMIREAEKPEEGFGKGSFVSIRAKCIKKV